LILLLLETFRESATKFYHTVRRKIRRRPGHRHLKNSIKSGNFVGRRHLSTIRISLSPVQLSIIALAGTGTTIVRLDVANGTLYLVSQKDVLLSQDKLLCKRARAAHKIDQDIH
jgi:hypothetical protein